jgi:capsid protein
MQTQRTVDAVHPPEAMLVTAPVVPPRSARRAAARRASNRRATARQHKGHIDGRIFEYVKDHPLSTAGDMAKRLNANHDTIAAEVSHMVRAGKMTKELGGQVAVADAPSSE